MGKRVKLKLHCRRELASPGKMLYNKSYSLTAVWLILLLRKNYEVRTYEKS